MLHPVNTSAAVWEELARLLAPERRCVAFDYRGHGASAKAGPFEATDYVDDAEAVIAALGLDRVHVVGGSLGGAIAALLAHRHPDRILSITALGSTLAVRLPEGRLDTMVGRLREVGVEEFFREHAPAILGPGHDPALVERVVGASGGRDVETVVAIIRAAFTTDVQAQVGGARAPALIATGGFDPTCTPADGEAMADTLGGVFVRLDEVGHLPMLERPVQVAALVSSHLARSEGV